MIPARLAIPILALAAILAGNLPAQDEISTRQIAIQAMYPVMIQALESGNYGQARNICDQIITWEPLNPVHHYNLACIEAKAGGARLPFAFDALAEAALLGFNDVALFQSDPDLSALRSTPRYRELLEFVKRNASGGSVPAPPAAAATPSDPPEIPPDPVFEDGVPVGLFFRMQAGSRTTALPQEAWYFAPDGWVYPRVEAGISATDLAAHSAKGRLNLVDGNLTVVWTDGRQATHALSRAAGHFTWNESRFVPVRPFDLEMPLVGIYEYLETNPGGKGPKGGGILELRPDGSFTWVGASFAAAPAGDSSLTVTADARTTGQWRMAGFSLRLTDAQGAVYRRLALPDDDPETPQRPDRILLGGSLYRKRPLSESAGNR